MYETGRILATHSACLTKDRAAIQDVSLAESPALCPWWTWCTQGSGSLGAKSETSGRINKFLSSQCKLSHAFQFRVRRVLFFLVYTLFTENLKIGK